MTAQAVRPSSSPQDLVIGKRQTASASEASSSGSTIITSNETLRNKNDFNDSSSSLKKTTRRKRQQTNNRRRRSITFASTTQVKFTLSHHDMSTDEKNNMWMQSEEVILTRKQRHQLIQQMEEQGYLNEESSEFTIRGLESYLKFNQAKQHKEFYRYTAMEEVLYEQEGQHAHGYIDEVAIALLYQSITKECQIRAESIANQDRCAIEQYLVTI